MPLCVTAIALLLLVLPAGAHAASWDEPAHVEEVRAPAEFATDAQGDGVLLFVTTGPDFAIAAKFRKRGGALSETQRLGAATTGYFDLEVADDGTAVAAWIERDPTRVRVATRPPGAARFGEPEDVATGDIQASEVIVALGGGDAAVGWRNVTTRGGQSRSTFNVALRERGVKKFRRPQQVMQSGTSHAIELAGDGSGFVVGGLSDGFRVARRDADGGFVTQGDMTLPNEQGNTGPQLAVSDSGRAVVATSSAPEGNGDPEQRHAVAAAGNTHSGFEPLDIVSGPGCRFAAAKVTPDDRIAVAWNAGKGSRSRVQGLVAERGQRIDDDLVETLSARNVRGEKIAAGTGRVVVTWQRKAGDGRNIEAASKAPGERWGDDLRVQRVRQGSFPEAGSSRNGTAWIAWTRFLGGSVINAAQVYASNGRVGRVTRVSDNGWFGQLRGSAFAPGVGGEMVMGYTHANVDPEHLDLAGYAGG